MKEFVVKSEDKPTGKPSTPKTESTSESKVQKEPIRPENPASSPSPSVDSSTSTNGTIQQLINKSKYGVDTPKPEETRSQVIEEERSSQKGEKSKGSIPWNIIILVVMIIIDVILGVVSYIYFSSK